MGDRCSLDIIMAEKDRPEFEKALNELLPGWGGQIWDDEEVVDGVFEGHMYEANYGLYTELEIIASKGCKFHGSQGAGSEYDAADFVTLNGEVFYAETNQMGEVVAPISLTTFQVNSKTVAELKSFVQGIEEIIDYLNELKEEK